VDRGVSTFARALLSLVSVVLGTEVGARELVLVDACGVRGTRKGGIVHVGCGAIEHTER
jgi:hypothetical protein